MKQYIYKFILLVIMPLLVFMFISFMFGFVKTGTFFCVLIMDGLFGLLRVNAHILEERKYNTSRLRIIKNKIIPFGKYVAMVLFGVCFFKPTKNNPEISQTTKEHEMIHKVQGNETGYFLMYFIYLVEALYWSIKLIIILPKTYFGTTTKFKTLVSETYKHVCFEQEAYNGNIINDYKNKRFFYGWIDFLFNDDDSKTNVSLKTS